MIDYRITIFFLLVGFFYLLFLLGFNRALDRFLEKRVSPITHTVVWFILLLIIVSGLVAPAFWAIQEMTFEREFRKFQETHGPVWPKNRKEGEKQLLERQKGDANAH